MQNCKCFGCKPNLIPDGYKGEVCSICQTPIGTFPGIPCSGSVCVKCLDNDHLVRDPVYKVKFPKCTCGKIVHNYNLLYHGVIQLMEGHNINVEDIQKFQEGVSKVQNFEREYRKVKEARGQKV